MEKNDFYKELLKYFETTSEEQIKRDWEATEEFDNTGLTIDELFGDSLLYYHTLIDRIPCIEPINNINLNPEFSSGFFLIKHIDNNGKCSICN